MALAMEREPVMGMGMARGKVLAMGMATGKVMGKGKLTERQPLPSCSQGCSQRSTSTRVLSSPTKPSTPDAFSSANLPPLCEGARTLARPQTNSSEPDGKCGQQWEPQSTPEGPHARAPRTHSTLQSHGCTCRASGALQLSFPFRCACRVP